MNARILMLLSLAGTVGFCHGEGILDDMLQAPVAVQEGGEAVARKSQQGYVEAVRADQPQGKRDDFAAPTAEQRAQWKAEQQKALEKAQATEARLTRIIKAANAARLAAAKDYLKDPNLTTKAAAQAMGEAVRDLYDYRNKIRKKADQLGWQPPREDLEPPSSSDIAERAKAQNLLEEHLRGTGQESVTDAARDAQREAGRGSRPEIEKPKPEKPEKPAYTPSATDMCFVAGTELATVSGSRKIESIAVGDLVLSFNEKTQSVSPSRVLAVQRSQRSDLARVRVGPHAVICSQNHRFRTAEGEWKEASRLGPEERVLCLNENRSGVAAFPCKTKLMQHPEPVAVFNLTVEGNPNYFVGGSRILCHNKKM